MKNKTLLLGIASFAIVALLIISILHSNTPTTKQHESSGIVAVSLYPLAYLVESIAQDTVTVVQIGEGVDPHEYAPSVRDTSTLKDADIVVIMGGGLEHWEEDAESIRNTEQKPLLAMNEIVSVYVSAEDTSTDEHGHDQGGIDPHSWLDPVLMQEMAITLRDEFTRLYPAHADMYARNTETLRAELSAIDSAYKTALASCTAGEALTSHDAFGYIGRRYNLDMHPIVGISTQDEPSAKLLAELKDEASGGVLGILTEERSIKKYAETLARETGLQLVSIDALELGVSGNENYGSVMYENLTALRTAYGCN